MMSNASLMKTLGMTMSMMLVALASTANAAEPSAADERGTLSQEATAAGPAVNTSATQAEPAVSTSSQPSSRRDVAAGPQAVLRNDRLNLDTTVVTGNRELPKVLYIVPWKKSDLGELPSQPFNTLLDEALTPVDRDVFRREVTYYGAVSGAADAAAAASAPQAERSEK
jgi:hypothetical protein